VAAAQRPRRGDEVASGESQGCGARHSGEARNAEDAEGDRDVEHRLAKIGGDRQCQHQRRKRQQDINPGDHQGLDTAAEIACEHPQPTTDREAEERRDQPDSQRDAGAEHQAAQNVATKRIGAEPVIRAGPGPAGQQIHVRWVRERQPIGGNRGGHDDRDPREPQPECKVGSTGRNQRGLVEISLDVKRGHGGSADRARHRAGRRQN